MARAPKGRRGWYRLPSGLRYHGRIPHGVDPLSVDELVEPVDGGPQVAAVALVDEELSEPVEVVEGPVERGSAGDEADGEAEVVGQESKPTARSRKVAKGD